jgi:hypothetical protein
MARLIHGDSGRRTTARAWLKLAEQVRRSGVDGDQYRHAPSADASVARVHELAGSIRLRGIAPSQKFLQADTDLE